MLAPEVQQPVGPWEPGRLVRLPPQPLLPPLLPHRQAERRRRPKPSNAPEDPSASSLAGVEGNEQRHYRPSTAVPDQPLLPPLLPHRRAERLHRTKHSHPTEGV